MCMFDHDDVSSDVRCTSQKAMRLFKRLRELVIKESNTTKSVGKEREWLRGTQWKSMETLFKWVRNFSLSVVQVNYSNQNGIAMYLAEFDHLAILLVTLLGWWKKWPFQSMTDPWDERYIYPHEWLIFMVNAGQSHGSPGICFLTKPIFSRESARFFVVFTIPFESLSFICWVVQVDLWCFFCWPGSWWFMIKDSW